MAEIHEELLTEEYVMSLFGLNPEEAKDRDHLSQLRNQKKLPYCAVSTKVRVYPREELEAWLMRYLKNSQLGESKPVRKRKVKGNGGEIAS